MSRSFPSRRNAKPLRPLTLEHLESRELMAGQVFADRVQLVPDSSHAGQFVLTIQGTDQNDKIALSQKNDNLTVKFNGKTAAVYSAQNLSGVMVDGGLGNDTISLPAKSTIPSVLLGGSGNDKLTGGGGSNLLVGGDGNDKVTGGRGANVLMGGEGNDVLTGGAGEDQLYGDGGNDKLNGKGGRNMLLGGAGADKLAGKKTTNFLVEGNIDAADQALREASPVHQFQEFLDNNVDFLLSIMPNTVSGSWKADAQGLGFKGGYNSDTGWQAGTKNAYASESGKGSVAASILGATVTGSINPQGQWSGMVSGSIPLGSPLAPVSPVVAGSLAMGSEGSLQICLGGGGQIKLPFSDKLSTTLQGCVKFQFSNQPRQSITYDDNAPKGSNPPASSPSPIPVSNDSQWNQLVDDVMTGLTTQVPAPDPWTWEVPADTPLTLSDPSYWNYSPSTYINYDSSPWSSPLDPNFFGPYTDPFQFDPYYQGGYNDPFRTDTNSYYYYDGTPYDSGTSYYDWNSYLPYVDYNYNYDYSGSYDSSYYDYSSSYSTSGSGGYSGGSGSSIYYDDNAPRYS